jgi:hypothetical protein
VYTEETTAPLSHIHRLFPIICAFCTLYIQPVCSLILCAWSTQLPHLRIPCAMVHGSEDAGIEPETVTRFAFGKSDTLASRLDLKNTHVLSAPNKPQPSSFHQLRLTQSQIKFGDL